MKIMLTGQNNFASKVRALLYAVKTALYAHWNNMLNESSQKIRIINVLINI